MNRGGKFVIWMCYAAVVAYIGYSWYTYSGPFRLAVEWQLAMFESYSLKMTLLALTVALIAPIAVVARLKGGPDLPNETERLASRESAGNGGAARPSAAGGRRRRGLARLPEVAGDHHLRVRRSQRGANAVLEPCGDDRDCAHRIPPAIRVETQEQHDHRRFFPLASSGWRRGEPFVYFVKTNATAYLPQSGGQIVMFSGRTPPFQMTTEKALLVRNGLPGPVGEAFRRTITLAETPIVLDMDPNADVEMYWIAAIASALLGLAFC